MLKVMLELARASRSSPVVKTCMCRNLAAGLQKPSGLNNCRITSVLKPNNISDDMAVLNSFFRMTQ